jgi:tripartite-type tricarboxylate transporter receptor subunit TctC
MQMLRALLSLFALSAFIAFALTTSATAESVADFYRGKSVTLVIGVGDGGHYDTVGRLIARHLRKYIPGTPNIIPQNMPGASQLRATEFSFNRAPRDGTSLLVVQPHVILNKVLNPAAAYEVQGFTWLGRLHPLDVVGVVWHTAPATTVSEARLKELVFGGNAPSGPASMIPWAVNRLAGTRIRVARGYQSEVAEFLAMERGEIDGIGNATLSELLIRFGDKVRFLYTSGISRIPKIPEVPTIVELVKDERDRPLMQALGAVASVGLTLAGPPQIPEDRVVALRSAFDQMTKDSELLDDLSRLHYDAQPISGAEVARLINDNFSLSPDVVERLKAATAPQ